MLCIEIRLAFEAAPDFLRFCKRHKLHQLMHVGDTVKSYSGLIRVCGSIFESTHKLNRREVFSTNNQNPSLHVLQRQLTREKFVHLINTNSLNEKEKQCLEEGLQN